MRTMLLLVPSVLAIRFGSLSLRSRLTFGVHATVLEKLDKCNQARGSIVYAGVNDGHTAPLVL